MERFLETGEGDSIKESTTQQIWHNALRVLKCYSLVAEQPKRCIAALEIFSQKLFVDDADNDANNKTRPPGGDEFTQDLDPGIQAPITSDQQLDISMEDLFSLWINESMWMNPVDDDMANLPAL